MGTKRKGAAPTNIKSLVESMRADQVKITELLNQSRAALAPLLADLGKDDQKISELLNQEQAALVPLLADLQAAGERLERLLESVEPTPDFSFDLAPFEWPDLESFEWPDLDFTFDLPDSGWSIGDSRPAKRKRRKTARLLNGGDSLGRRTKTDGFNNGLGK